MRQTLNYLFLIVGLPVVLVLMTIPRGRAWLYELVNW
ncbi:hypothetical protein FHS31_001905 [Sphingomonas vulcanisoli]|uniref:Uncharacterized protein n=1 Tax=Sphingomonas vulcanisoli TaxID=1658060 RepID=A0ABX0TRY8_9SPHN|nr:hypothetical protein [Sphingomonas vulcanisoli]